MRPALNESQATSNLPGPKLLHFQVAICGAVVMLVEILGTRIIGPVFGVGLYVWSALLSITLAALALGYVAGGSLADRLPQRDWVSWVMVASGSCLAIEPFLRPWVLSLADELGLKVGPVLAAFILFFPSLCFLGMVGPLAIRRLVERVEVAGRRAGGVYALSTVGSLLGTFTVGFYLIPNFPVNALVLGASTLLLLAAAVPLFMRRRRVAVVAFVLPLAAATQGPRSMPQGFVSVDRAESLLGMVEVIDREERNVRFLRMDHSIIGAQFKDTGAAGFAFLHIIEALRFAKPDAKSLLQIGLGAGSVPAALAKHGMPFDVVEIDPAVVKMAEAHFGFHPSGLMAIEDARTFLRAKGRTYDVIVHDAFSGGSSPEHLFSSEMLELIKRRLAPNGLLVVNFVGFADGPYSAATLAVNSTLGSQFAVVRAFRDSAPSEGPEGLSNVLFFASANAFSFPIPAGATFETAECEQAARGFESWEILKDAPHQLVITDAQNPLARLQAPIAAAHYESMSQLLPREVWIR